MRKGRILSDISKRVLIVEGRDEIEIIQKVGSFYGAKAGDIY